MELFRVVNLNQTANTHLCPERSLKEAIANIAKSGKIAEDLKSMKKHAQVNHCVENFMLRSARWDRYRKKYVKVIQRYLTISQCRRRSPVQSNQDFISGSQEQGKWSNDVLEAIG